MEWIGHAENPVIAGPSGTGKSDFTEGPAKAVTENDLRLAWFTLKTLSAAIGKSKSTDPPLAPSPGSAART